ncbi:hypothetical protein BSL78_12817 [Apostichopus japonicus]|uniref:Uncharacterized protein n=1 Tax=Stichopus japonicus TaxID=307972 RepID=A0A2G8KQP1_STIJA|nr:hypothetical protein BSL78_12817 [Apostichopus japonicus]
MPPNNILLRHRTRHQKHRMVISSYVISNDNRKSEQNIFISKRETDDSLEALEVSDEDIATPINLDDTLSSEEEFHLHYEDVTLSNATNLLQESKRYRKGDALCGKHAKVNATTSTKKPHLINLDFVPKPPTQPPSGPVSRRHHNRASRQDTEAPRRPFLPKIKRQLGVNRIDANQSNWLETLPPSPESLQFTLPPISGVNMPRPPTQPRPSNSNSQSRRDSTRRKFGRKIGPGKNIWTGDRHDILAMPC